MDVAALSLRIDSSDVVKAANDLDRFATASARAGATAGNQSGSIAKMAQEYGRTAERAGQFSNAASRAADAAQRSAAAASAGASSLIRFGDGYDLLTGKLNSNFVAVNRNIEAWNRQGKAVNDNVGAIRANTGNIAAQFQDIGVTAAMGMNPLIIGLQQGTQLSAVLAQTGGGALATLRAAFASIISPVALVTIALVSAVAAMIQWAGSTEGGADATYRAENGLKTYTTAMGYTKKEVEKLNSVTVTWGDTIKAVFQVGWQRAAEALGISTDWMSKKWSGFLSWLGTATRAALAAVYAAILGTMDLRKNVLNDALNGELGLDTLTKGYKDRYAQAQRVFDDVGKQAQANARARQDEMAKSMFDKPSGGGGKSTAEKIADLMQEAQAEITAEENRLKAVGMSARAAAEMEQRTKLLNQAQQAGIPLTAGLRTEIERLSGAYADAKIAADVAEAIQGVTDTIEKQISAVNDQTALIGLYGDALARARIEMEMLAAARNALPRGEELSLDDTARIYQGAGRLARDQALQGQLQRAEDIRKNAEDSRYAMDLEQGALRLSGEALIAYNYAMAEKIRYQREGIQLSPAEVAAIEAAGQAYAAQRHQIDRQARAIEDARDVTKGFFSDWLNGVREGGNIFKTFADSVVNSLNRIIDKLLDRTIDDFFNNMMKSSGSGSGSGSGIAGIFSSIAGVLGFANGGTFGTAQRFANGGTFTNAIVSTPTLFRFANGAALGEMGEAGPEAIMPLKRGPNGALGVQAHGGGLRKAEINIKQDFHMQGVMTPADVAAMVRQGSVAAVQEVKRNLDAYLREWDIDGAVST